MKLILASIDRGDLAAYVGIQHEVLWNDNDHKKLNVFQNFQK
jgi:hypothetical protein